MIVRDFLICLLQMYLLEDLEKNMLPYRRENFLGKFLVYFVIALVMLGINHLESSIFNMVMIPVTYMIVSMVVFRGNIWKKLVIVCCYYVLAIIPEFLFATLTNAYGVTGASEGFGTEIEKTLALLLMSTMTFLFIKCINQVTICILGGTGTVGVTACKVLSKLGYSLRVSVRNIETIKDTGMYMAPNIQLFELDIDKESNIGKFFKGSDLVIGAIGPSADYSEKMLLEAMAENIPYVDPGGIHLIRKMRNSSMKGTAIVGSGIFPGLSGWMLSSVLKEAFNDDLIEMIIGGVYNFSKAAAIDYVEEIKSYKAGIPMACVRNGKILPAQKRSPLNLPTRISKLSILPYVTEEIQEIIQGKYMLNIDSYTAAPVSLFSIVNKAHCQKKDLVNALMGQKNSNQKAFIWVRQNKGNDSRCIYFEGKNPSVLTGEILAITANAIFEMPRKDGIYTMASYLEKYQVLDELKKIDKFKSEGKI